MISLAMPGYSNRCASNCTAFFHLRNIAKIRPFLSQPDAEKIIHAFITCRLDYCNALFTGLPKKAIDRLQLIQNSAARLLTKTKKREHTSPVHPPLAPSLPQNRF